MDFAPVNAFGRPVVQPSAANRDTLGVRPVNDPRETQIPATPLAAKNAADLRVSTGPRQSSSTTDTRDEEKEHSLSVRGRTGNTAPKHPDGDERGSSIDVTI